MKLCASILSLGLFFSSILEGTSYVTAKIQGQLGNQMFIIAATEAYAKDHNVVPVYPDFFKDIRWNMQENWRVIFSRLNRKVPDVLIKDRYSEPFFHYKKIPYINNVRLEGYFQSERYFKNHKVYIKNLFRAPPHIISYLKEKYGFIIDHPKSVSIHYRNYLADDPDQKYHPNVGVQYFRRALKHFPDDSLFVVFSNDIVWCRKQLQGIAHNIIFISNESLYHDFYLMSLCKHNIISNSSFSWWAAYLNGNSKKKVIAPKRWFGKAYKHNTNDLIPDSWLRL